MAWARASVLCRAEPGFEVRQDTWASTPARDTLSLSERIDRPSLQALAGEARSDTQGGTFQVSVMELTRVTMPFFISCSNICEEWGKHELERGGGAKRNIE